MSQVILKVVSATTPVEDFPLTTSQRAL